MQHLVMVGFIFVALQNNIHGRELSMVDRNQIALTCIQQTGIQRSTVDEAIVGNIPENDVKYKEFLACSYKKQGFQSESGEMLMDNVKKFIKKYYEAANLKPLDLCGGHSGATHGEIAFNALQCIMDHLKKLEEK